MVNVNRPGLTAERFRACVSGTVGARGYLVGDLGRWSADGRSECLGRVDFQVKVRGHRIELGEIDAALVSHSGVQQAVVTVREDRPGETRLVAYLVKPSGGAASVEEIRAHVVSRLPDYMVPSVFVFLEKLPLTPNGKVDRRALPKPEGRPELERAYVAPRNETEEKLTKIWSEVLHVERIGINDNFFELGGHSLLTVSMVAKIHAVFGRSLPVSVVFQDVEPINSIRPSSINSRMGYIV